MKFRINKMNILMDFYAVLIILLSGTVFASVESMTAIYNCFLAIFIAVNLIFVIKSVFPGKYKKSFFIIVIIVIAYVALEYLISSSTASLFFTRMIILLLFLLSFPWFSKKNVDIFHHIFRIVIFLSFISIFLFVLIDIIKIQIPYTLVSTGPYTHYTNYCNLLFEYSPMYTVSFGGITFQRLQSIFWEPGAYQIFLNFAFYRLLFKENVNQKLKSKLISLLAVNIILTLSTTGIALFIVIVFLRIYYSKYFNRTSRMALIIPIFCFFAIVFSYLINIKLANAGGKVSYSLRIADIVQGWELFTRHPLFGVGFNNQEAFMQIQKMDRGSSNGVITFLFSMGLVGSIIFIIPFIHNYIRMNRENRNSQIVFIIWFLVVNLTEPIITTPFFWLIFAYEIYTMVSRGMRNERDFKKIETARG